MSYILAAVIRREDEELRKVLVSVLNPINVISVTTDLWSSNANVAFRTYTGHSLDKNWTLPAAVLDTAALPESHIAENISQFTNYARCQYGCREVGGCGQ